MDAARQPPDWFVLMQQWIERGKGNTGVTLPFLVGALTLKQGKTSASIADVSALLEAIRTEPVADHYVGVRRCGNIDAPVLSALHVSNPLQRACEFRSASGQLALAFSPDAMSMFGGLDCNGSDDCLEKLLSYAVPHVEAGNFSRSRRGGGEYGYYPMSQDSIEFVRVTIGLG